MIRTLSIGESSYDMYIQVDNMPKENTKTRFVSKVGCGGGTISNVAYMLGKWGVSSCLGSVVGNDVFGNRIKKELESVGVDIRYVETSYDKDTVISLNVLNDKTGIYTRFDVADEFCKMKSFEFDFQPDVIITDGSDTYASKSTIDRFPKAISIIHADRFTNEIADVIKKCQYVICSKTFAEQATKMMFDFNNTTSLVSIFDTLRKRFDRQNIIITLEDKGAIYEIANQIKISPALAVKVKDTTGAGDIFTGAFAYAIASGSDVEKAVKLGNIAAGLSVQTVGTRLSVPRLDDVNKIYEQSLS